METPFHALSLAECFATLNSHPDFGLSPEQQRERLLKYGPNSLPLQPSPATWRLIVAQFSDRLVQILLAAAFISLFVAIADGREQGFSASMFFEPAVILVILVVNAAIGVAQESSAEQALEALKRYAPEQVKVVRGSAVTLIASAALVPGDVVEVQAGDRIPADGRLSQQAHCGRPLKVDESLLTGETGSVPKQLEPVSHTATCMEQKNMLFCGTLCTSGKARMLVTCTGASTAIGRIHASITQQQQQESAQTSPLGRQLDEFGDLLAKVISVICFSLWALNVSLATEPFNAASLLAHFKLSIALAVAAIPEGLSIIITTTLALGTKRMAKKNAIVRKLSSVETLGCCSVICCDKTGTLTCNKMSVTRAAFFSQAAGCMEELRIEGSGYNPFALVTAANEAPEECACERECIWISSLISALCNSASPVQFAHSNGEFEAIGDATEVALKVWTERLQTNNSIFNRKLNAMELSERASAVNCFILSQYESLATLEFDRVRKSMSVLVERHHDSRKLLLVKGAPENILERCSHYLDAQGKKVVLDAAAKATVELQIKQYAEQQALRVMALAYKEINQNTLVDQIISASVKDESEKFIALECGLTFTCIAGMADGPRVGVSEAISKCREAGVRLIVLTGDHQSTSESICREIGLLQQGCSVDSLSFTAKHLDSWNDLQLEQALESAIVFSRVEPRHKQRIVQALRARGEIVGMTGDGINDAPALQIADIGISMGSGTDVAKLASDMILVDDNFSTLVAAIEEGRSIYSNTKQFIRYLISSNIGEVLAIFIASLWGIPCLLTPVQLLWVNLVTDGIPATALGFNPADPSVMRRGPRSATEPLIGAYLLARYCLVGLWVGLATVSGYLLSEGDLMHKQTVALSVMVMLEMFNALNALSESESLFQIPPWKNLYLALGIVGSVGMHVAVVHVPWISRIMGTVPLDWVSWKRVVALAVPVVFIEEAVKVVVRRVQRVAVNKRKVH